METVVEPKMRLITHGCFSRMVDRTEEVQATFNIPLYLQSFPFDSQKLSIDLVMDSVNDVTVTGITEGGCRNDRVAKFAPYAFALISNSEWSLIRADTGNTLDPSNVSNSLACTISCT